MADKEESATRGNDWEVVSLTASAYAASPGPKAVDLKDDDKEATRYEAETSHPLYMSGHFVFQPNELEKIATEPSELTEASKKKDFGFSVEQENGSHGKDEGDLTLKGLELSDEFAGLEVFEEKGKREDVNIYKTAMSSLHDERAIAGSNVDHQKERIQEPTEPVTPSDISSDLNSSKDEKHDEVTNLPPCEAWWKRSAASLIAQAKEANTVWSIFIAGAVLGIVILGQRWQKEKWQILQLKWESSIGNEKAGRLMGPISRLKQVFIGGQQRESFVRVRSQNEN